MPACALHADREGWSDAVMEERKRLNAVEGVINTPVLQYSKTPSLTGGEKWICP